MRVSGVRSAGRTQGPIEHLSSRAGNNPYEFAGPFGRGIDDIMFDKKGNPVILEYKGSRSELLGDQMKKSWICRKIRELQGRNDPMAAILEQAMQKGRLTGRIYRTPVDEVGNEGKTFREGSPLRYRGKCP